MLAKLLNKEHDFPVLGKLKIGDKVKDDRGRDSVVIGFEDSSFDYWGLWRLSGWPSHVIVEWITDGTVRSTRYLELNKISSLSKEVQE